MILFLTTADTEILALSRVARDLPEGFPALKAINPTRLPGAQEPGTLVAGAAMVLVRLLGGRRAWEAGFDKLSAHCRRAGIPFLAWSGEQHADAELTAASTAPAAIVGEAFEYVRHGGIDNLRHLLLFLSDTLLMTGYGFEAPAPLPEHGLYHPALPEHVSLADYLRQRWDAARPSVGVLFYRTHWMSGNREFVDALIEAVEQQGCNVLPVFCYSLRSAGGPPAALQDLILDDQGQPRVDCLISTLSYSMGTLAVKGATIAEGWSVEFLEAMNLPIVQALTSTSSAAEWQASDAGLTPLDTAMTVAMPEFDGRIITVPFSFKEVVAEDSTVGGAVTRYLPVADWVQVVAGLATRLARLRHAPNATKRVAIMFSSYPTKAARIGNAVGLDSPASALRLLYALHEVGYDLGGALPADSDSLMQTLIASGTYDKEFLTEDQLRGAAGQVHATEYQQWFERWPDTVRAAVQQAWGSPPGEVYRHNGAVRSLRSAMAARCQPGSALLRQPCTRTVTSSIALSTSRGPYWNSSTLVAGTPPLWKRSSPRRLASWLRKSAPRCDLPVRSSSQVWSGPRTRSATLCGRSTVSTCQQAPVAPPRVGWRMSCPPGAIFTRSIRRRCPPRSLTASGRIWPTPCLRST